MQNAGLSNHQTGHPLASVASLQGNAGGTSWLSSEPPLQDDVMLTVLEFQASISHPAVKFSLCMRGPPAGPVAYSLRRNC